MSSTEVKEYKHVDDYLAVGQEAGASDIHLGVNAPPLWRMQGVLQPIWPDAPRLTKEETAALADAFLPEVQKEHLRDRGDADFAYANDFGRFRTSVVRQRLGTDLVFRIINTKVKTMDELGLPEHLKLLTRYQNGLILVTGSVGSGKSTTLAALVEQVNMERKEHIITLEDPIEYVFEPKGCHITQREVHTHTLSFGAALRGALREDPDVIMIGEMRDLETISLAITASETGSPCSRDAAHRKCIPHARSPARCLSRRSTGADSHHGERIAARHHQSAINSACRWNGSRARLGNTHQHARRRQRHSRSENFHAAGNHPDRTQTGHAVDG